MSATNRGTKRRDNDFYPTPDDAINALLDALPLRGGWRVLEPGAGSGNIVKALSRYEGMHIDALEIREEEREHLEPLADRVIIGDYMTAELEPYDLIIGNPPFSEAMAFVKRSLELVKPGGMVIFLLRTAFLESDARFEFWKDPGNQLAGLYTLHKRPSFTGKGTDATSYSWFVWQPGGDGKQTIKVI